MGNWSYIPTYRSYNPIYNWKGAHLVLGPPYTWPNINGLPWDLFAIIWAPEITGDGPGPTFKVSV